MQYLVKTVTDYMTISGKQSVGGAVAVLKDLAIINGQAFPEERTYQCGGCKRNLIIHNGSAVQVDPGIGYQCGTDRTRDSWTYLEELLTPMREQFDGVFNGK